MPQFVHRTYAEYLFAKFLYEGFQLDEEQHNGLLDSESPRELIANEILVEKQYECVGVFLDSMLKEILENREWCNLIEQRELPNRLKDFARATISPIKRESIRIVHSKRVPKTSIVSFILNCLDATLSKSEIRQYLISKFEMSFEFFKYLYDQRSDLLKRCLDYYDGAGQAEVTDILEKMLYGPNGRISHIAGDSNGTKNERKQNIKLVFNFMGKHREIWKQMQKKEFDSHKSITLKVLICNENYDGLLEQYHI